jgi:D-alanyl-D-alanine dipeptidase
VRIGAIKTALNADRYDGRYVQIAYPGGDVPREIGVCTDVIIRALRNAGRDLQRELQDDLRSAPRAYPMIRKPNPAIDHRRVKSLLPLFQRSYEPHSIGLDDPADPLRPGDVIFMDTFPDRPGSEHVGIIADGIGRDGHPLVINNWTDGTVTKPMDLLAQVPITQRFRLRPRLPDHGPIAALKTQLLTVVSPEWSSTRAELRRYARAPGGVWRSQGAAIPVVLGHAGYGWGDGLHGQGAATGRSGPTKREGDGRSPAGAFELASAYGYAAPGVRPLQIPYRQVAAAERCVDDPRSKFYNQIRSTRDTSVDWNSSEAMHRDDDLYELAIQIAHNTRPVRPSHGSCIFLHVWESADRPVTGCTALDKRALFELAQWLQPNAALLISLPRADYAALRTAWGLP